MALCQKVKHRARCLWIAVCETTMPAVVSWFIVILLLAAAVAITGGL